MVLTEIVYKQYSLSIAESKMNLHFAFHAFATLSFTIKYKLSNDSYQDFFIFQGNESHAHFYRQDGTLKLYLNHMEHVSSYQFGNMTSNFWFSWPEFTINDTLMTVMRKSDVKNINFTNFTFVSPILEFNDHDLQPITKTLDYLSEINYNYLILIMVVVVIVLKVDAETIIDFAGVIKTRF